MVLEELDGGSRKQRLRYRRFSEEGLLREIESPFDAVQWQAALGSESFTQRIRDRVKGLHKERREMTSVRRATLDVSPQDVLRRVARRFALPPKRLLETKPRALEARNLAMWMIWENCTVTLREVGEMFGHLDYAAVAQRIRRTRLRHSSQTARQLLKGMSNV
jgi:chromosomal replication initiation ATPase DnaA